MNEFYAMPPMPEAVKAGILKGMYKYKASDKKSPQAKAHLLGSGAILNEAVKAKEILESNYNVAADVWSVTSYKELYADACEVEHWNMLHPDDRPKISYIQQCFQEKQCVFVAATDYLKALPYSIAQWIPGRFAALGTDGYGRSDSRAALRNYFEVDGRFITLAALQCLALEGKISPEIMKKAIEDLDIDPEKVNPVLI
ncbi:MAG: hypothetical protein ACE5NG_21125 [bacterium]